MLEPGWREGSSHSGSKGPGARALGRRSLIRLCRPSAAFSAVTGAVSSPVLGSCINNLLSVFLSEAVGRVWVAAKSCPVLKEVGSENKKILTPLGTYCVMFCFFS